MTHSVFTYNGEMQLLRLHLSILAPYVDRFIIVEANKTFTGLDKPLYYFRDQRFLKEWWNKIDYYIVDQWDDPDMWNMAFISPQTQGAAHWKREFFIKENIQKALIRFDVQDEDTLFIGDVDEIVDPLADLSFKSPTKAKLRVYNYYLNNRSNEEFWGTLVCKYRDIKGKCLNELRSDKGLYSKGEKYFGWHFSSMGGVDAVRKKLDDSYTIDSYNMNYVPGHVEMCIRERKDLLNRPFTYTIDESEWPTFLTNNRDKYKQMLW